MGRRFCRWPTFFGLSGQLAEEVRAGQFRDDLYYRLAVAYLHIPPLRERPEDVALFAKHFVQKFLDLPNAEAPRIEDHLPPLVMDRLLAHDWPGNVRELRNAIERAVVLNMDPLSVSPQRQGNTEPNSSTNIQAPFAFAKQQVIDDFEKRYITEMLKQHSDNISACARSAGINRRSFQRLMKRHQTDT